jgi:hypothetical protein
MRCVRAKCMSFLGDFFALAVVIGFLSETGWNRSGGRSKSLRNLARSNLPAIATFGLWFLQKERGTGGAHILLSHSVSIFQTHCVRRKTPVLRLKSSRPCNRSRNLSEPVRLFYQAEVLCYCDARSVASGPALWPPWIGCDE